MRYGRSNSRNERLEYRREHSFSPSPTKMNLSHREPSKSYAAATKSDSMDRRASSVKNSTVIKEPRKIEEMQKGISEDQKSSMQTEVAPDKTT